MIAMTLRKEYDVTFPCLFFLFASSLISSSSLLTKMIERYNIPHDYPHDACDAIQIRIGAAIKVWMDFHFGD